VSLSPANFSDDTVDKEAVKAIEEEVAGYKRQLKELEKPLGEQKAALDRCTASYNEVDKANVSRTYGLPLT